MLQADRVVGAPIVGDLLEPVGGAPAEVAHGLMAMVPPAADADEAGPHHEQPVRIIPFARDHGLPGQAFSGGAADKPVVGAMPVEVAVSLEQGLLRDLANRLFVEVPEHRSLPDMRPEAALPIEPVHVRPEIVNPTPDLADPPSADLEDLGAALRKDGAHPRVAGQRRDLSEHIAGSESRRPVFVDDCRHVLEEYAGLVLGDAPGAGAVGITVEGRIAHLRQPRCGPELAQGLEHALLGGRRPAEERVWQARL